MDASAPWRELEPNRAERQETGDGGGGGRVSAQSVALFVAAILVAGSLGAAVAVAGRQSGSLVLDPAASGSTAIQSQGPALLVVEVVGAVAHPGVYELPVGSRVADAIAAAGGYAADVDPRALEARLNLAARLQDGQVIRVPRRGETGASGIGPVTDGASTTGLINLNTASVEQLDTLPGIGPVTAQKIVASREQKPFTSVEDLLSRKLVTAATMAKIRALVTVN